MGFTFRKSFKIGKLINLSVSKSGIGLSAGVKGFRIGTGPKGNYISMSKSGIGYKKYFGGKKKTSDKKKTTTKQGTTNTNKNIADIDSYNTENIVDSSSRELVETIRANRKNFLFGKKTPIYYSVDDTMEGVLDSFYDSFTELEDCDSMWYVYAKAREAVGNYHNIDSSKILRKEITIKYGTPNFIKTNVVVPCIEAGDQELYFFPDKLLVVEGKKIGALSYNNLTVEVEKGRFKEEGEAPSDAKVIETTYKYTNKDGGPDKRYSYNPKASIVEYTYIYFKGNKGFNECIMVSKNDVGETLKFEVEKLKSVAKYNDNEEESVTEHSAFSKTTEEENDTPKENNMFYKK